jgi:5'(3')-deoxyribonucleotidase
MKRPIVAVDLDDVVVDHYEEVVKFHNEAYGTNHTVDDYISDNWAEVWKVDKAEAERRAQEFAARHIKHRRMKEGAVKGLNHLHERYDLVVVTVRRKQHVQPTLDWVRAELPDLFSAIRFVPVWEEENCPTKAEVCVELGASYLVDDNLKYCSLAAEAGLQTVLFGSYAWNQADRLPPGVTRCLDWPAVVEYFDGTG